ncbi:AlpA family phage regulatory protein [Vibrio chagasii]|uniref:helix-turn-helix transcriptional regulator n=1 Tax=Vibrio crassostreae TaxID=246167 RepID=UPI00104CDC5C|nr:AlpA family phage regulatory protein [Vibrio crassostreae]CAH6849756.1 AlpA family phage regulatory protein [Vibrio chagasii]TCT44339.1 CP4-57 regulatory protein AlpA [Vibrio crassostreae]CAH6861028.1 AlpA family phage regulatory protein [Vibrio chagasii]CAH6901092.1 AlpA family phage regulatory protein [Vibrio chagasii]CAH6903571.1 AlpA family phage regulatory protein [Vibrio chagasii]
MQTQTIEQPKPLTITTKEILTMTGFSRTTLWRKERDDSFPKATLGKGLRSRKEVNEWLKDQNLI